MADFDEPLCGCLQDMFSCLIVFCVPCGGICIQAYSVDKATSSGMVCPFLWSCCLGCIGSAVNRGQIRQKYHIEGSFIMDCLISCFCGCCAATQEYREVMNRERPK
ncbi:unnamed protein product [Blepharisma stoltei]|uniref:Uncharacterized protein n=1 Tax=Blepharisma stoltei TaxID=1481888 RepID=A0AAU9KJB3_9CILI|nr:unnamed protein product [Blepharisma stoltei]